MNRLFKGSTTQKKRYHIQGVFPPDPLELVFLALLQELEVRVAELPDLLLDACDARRLEVVEEDGDLLLQLAQLGLERPRRQVQRHVRHLLEGIVEAGVD